MAITVFLAFVGLVLGLSFFLARRTKSASGYYAAGGSIHWSVNGIAFAGDYLSAASFLGICGMIATAGYDGFLYSIGYLAGWIVALFIVAEPMKRLGKYTFTDALDAKFNSKGIKLAAAVSTLIVSICYLIPQMVGAGVLVEPLLGLPHAAGVIIVGAIVITIVATAGMTSTTYVQFLKGGMLIIFSLALVIGVCVRGLSTTPDRLTPGQDGKAPFRPHLELAAVEQAGKMVPADSAWEVVEWQESKAPKATLAKLAKDGQNSWWVLSTPEDGAPAFLETQWEAVDASGAKTINGAPASPENQLRYEGNLVAIQGKTGPEATTGSISPFRFLALLGDKDTIVRRWASTKITDSTGDAVTVHVPVLTPGNLVLRPGLKYKLEGSTPLQKLDFISLMLALFCGTAALPHILIRYYTVPSPACARKSTIVAIAAIGFFYILTLFMGLGAMVSGVVNLADNNMSAPLLAKSFGTLLFALISAIAFATVLGTVSGLIVAASGAVAHDLMDRFAGINMDESQKVRAGKAAAFGVGILAIVLGILFKGMNVNFLVGLAFAVAASANLPAIIMLLFWKKTTAQGITASIVIGIITALVLILLSPSMFKQYGWDPLSAPVPFDNPGFISIPLSFITLVIVSLMSQKRIAVSR
ncbi:MAG: cation acetate symporter [FCB group bacterium]|jgi:cation/acetate symporter|nr:cation acetate symporter [FCB group bacterium]